LVRWVSDSRGSAELINEQTAGLSTILTPGSEGISSASRRLVYPYSIVPGGVISAQELHQAADHDPVVRAHYAGFDYQHARVVEVKRPELVYLSYRRGNHIYWTSKQASLRMGEKLITDGRITARTRCGNQVSVLPQANTAPHEPMMAELDRPDAVASGMQRALPLTSDLLQVDPGLSIGPATPGRGFFGPPGTFMPTPIAGGPPSPKTPTNGCSSDKNGSTSTDTNCNSQNPTPPPPAVPEPATLVLVSSGVAAILARLRSVKK
jgi:hypothetical protein